MDNFDCTTLVRKALPLPQVTLDSGPCSEYAMDSIFRQYKWILGESIHNVGPAIQEFQYEAYLLSAWATRGWAPNTALPIIEASQ